MSSFVDTHCHVLPELDDGARSEEESIQMLKDAIQSGISCIFTTPHLIPKGIYHPSHERLLERLSVLKRIRDEHHLDIKLKSGCEFRLNDESLDVILEQGYLPYEGTDYVLVEMTLSTVRHGYIDTCISELIAQGRKVVIAHPERYFNTVDDAIGQVKRWIKSGCTMQVNRTSILNLATPTEHKIALALLEQGLVHLVASDAHRSEGSRILKLTDVYELLSRKLGKTEADRLLVENPSRLAQNTELLEASVTPRNWFKQVLRRFKVQ